MFKPTRFILAATFALTTTATVSTVTMSTAQAGGKAKTSFAAAKVTAKSQGLSFDLETSDYAEARALTSRHRAQGTGKGESNTKVRGTASLFSRSVQVATGNAYNTKAADGSGYSASFVYAEGPNGDRFTYKGHASANASSGTSGNTAGASASGASSSKPSPAK
jgi:hypothetical protein